MELLILVNYANNVLYDWVIVREMKIQHPDENPVLGRYLGSEIDVGPEMNANIIKTNGEVTNHSKYRGLKNDEKSNVTHISLRNEFDISIRDIYGP